MGFKDLLGECRYKLPDPVILGDVYDADKTNFDTWLAFMKAKLDIDGKAIGNKRAQFWYVYRHLDDVLQKWMLPLTRRMECLQSPDLILSRLTYMFVDRALIWEEMRSFVSIRQGNDTVSAYAKRLKTTIDSVNRDWTTHFRVHIIWHGLRPDLRTLLVKVAEKHPDELFAHEWTYAGFVAFAQRFESMLDNCGSCLENELLDLIWNAEDEWCKTCKTRSSLDSCTKKGPRHLAHATSLHNSHFFDIYRSLRRLCGIDTGPREVREKWKYCSHPYLNTEEGIEPCKDNNRELPTEKFQKLALKHLELAKNYEHYQETTKTALFDMSDTLNQEYSQEMRKMDPYKSKMELLSKMDETSDNDSDSDSSDDEIPVVNASDDDSSEDFSDDFDVDSDNCDLSGDSDDSQDKAFNKAKGGAASPFTARPRPHTT